MYLPPQKFFRNQILLDYLGWWRNQSCQIFFQSVHSGVFGKGSNFAIFSVNRGWPLQLLYYRTTVIENIFLSKSHNVILTTVYMQIYLNNQSINLVLLIGHWDEKLFILRHKQSSKQLIHWNSGRFKGSNIDPGLSWKIWNYDIWLQSI